MNLLREYIIYVRRSKNKFGIHSPFVFDFVAKGMTVSPDYTTKRKLKKIVSDYRKNSNQIEINDLGAGSKKLGKLRRISDIARTSGSKGPFALLLYQCAMHWKCINCLELGTSLGIGSMYLAAVPHTHVTSIDACKNTQNLAENQALQAGFDNIQFIHSDFESYLTLEKPIIQQLIFIDGHHQGNALKHYLELLEPWSDDQTIFILDDIRWSDDMKAAWDDLVQDDRYHVSLDFFRMGILVKRPEQAKEHFVIRIPSIWKNLL